jgi:RNA-directed DNA polymerase
VMIPKRGKPGQFRPLGVPTVEDRVVQAAVLQLLEPIFEAEFYTVSYGFRPKRSVRDAVEHLRLAIKPPKERSQPRRLSPVYQWVIEGDIKACFDNIDHHAVMMRLRRRVGDLKVTRLVLAFLKAGILAEEGFLRSDAGTPQGGILSPLLANVVLSAIEARYERFIAPGRTRDGKAYVRPGDQVRKFRHRERKAGRPVFLPVRYADDFVVLVAGSEEQARDEKEALAAYLGAELKLTLSAEKTHVTALTEGFDFLGHRIRLRWDDRWGYWPRVEIPKKKVRDLCHRIKQLTNRGHTCRSFQAVIDGLNPVLRGWGNFYRHCYYAKDVFTRVDHYAFAALAAEEVPQDAPARGSSPLLAADRRAAEVSMGGRASRRDHGRHSRGSLQPAGHGTTRLREEDVGEPGAQRKVHAGFGSGGWGNHRRQLRHWRLVPTFTRGGERWRK